MKLFLKLLPGFRGMPALLPDSDNMQYIITIICTVLATYVRHRYARHSLYYFFSLLSIYLKRIVGNVWGHIMHRRQLHLIEYLGCFLYLSMILRALLA